MRVDLRAPDWATHWLSDLTDWNREPVPVERMRPFELPADVYFEYAFQDAAGRRRPDPANENPILNPWWEFASNINGPDYHPHPLAMISGVAPAGRVLRLVVDSVLLGQTRRLLVYSPPGLAQAALPHVVFQDGKAYFGWGKVPQVLDSLMNTGQIGPAHLLFVPPRDRTWEYAFNPLFRRFLVEEVLPLVERHAPCDGRRVAWGASLGGLLSAQLAWQYPEIFQKVVSQSGAFLFSEDMDQANPFVGSEGFLKVVRKEGGKNLAWHLDCGTLEWLLASNRNLRTELAGMGMRVALVERSAGHNWINWRNGIAAGLQFALEKSESKSHF